jgi:hypothetical protein
VDHQGNDILNADDIYSDPLAADSLPADRMVKAQDAWPQSTTAANYVGADLVLAGGTGARVVTITNVANLAGDTFQFQVVDTNGVYAATTWTEGVGGAPLGVDCVNAGLTTIQCACAFYARGVASPIAGITFARTDATCSDAKVFFGPTPGVASNTVGAYTDGGTAGLTYTQRANGNILVPSSSCIEISGATALSGGVSIQGASNQINFLNSLACSGSSYATVVAGSITNAGTFSWGMNAALSTGSEIQFSSTTAYSGANADKSRERGNCTRHLHHLPVESLPGCK